ncbi:uncharacterized protein ACHE_41353S [Aspergillus chevalieri]|uniref:Uncharacterized protein n=1 Tax=Aspergillus chevalieri TaxID=182096 RepID=A0A7R7ZPN6_ASPCH|nr:uncharacterized protein ACHE_41353S [Aspergillus chevalieri]BCR88789.1 hypothetical protein ACHE_41353S [Aspergillus chevalieri]
MSDNMNIDSPQRHMMTPNSASYGVGGSGPSSAQVPETPTPATRIRDRPSTPSTVRPAAIQPMEAQPTQAPSIDISSIVSSVTQQVMSEMIRQQATISTTLSTQLREYVDTQTQQQETRWHEIQQSILGNQTQQHQREPEQPVHPPTEQAHQPESNRNPRGHATAPQTPNPPMQAIPSPQPVIELEPYCSYTVPLARTGLN